MHSHQSDGSHPAIRAVAADHTSSIRGGIVDLSVCLEIATVVKNHQAGTDHLSEVQLFLLLLLLLLPLPVGRRLFLLSDGSRRRFLGSMSIRRWSGSGNAFHGRRGFLHGRGRHGNVHPQTLHLDPQPAKKVLVDHGRYAVSPPLHTPQRKETAQTHTPPRIPQKKNTREAKNKEKETATQRRKKNRGTTKKKHSLVNVCLLLSCNRQISDPPVDTSHIGPNHDPDNTSHT